MGDRYSVRRLSALRRGLVTPSSKRFTVPHPKHRPVASTIQFPRHERISRAIRSGKILLTRLGENWSRSSPSPNQTSSLISACGAGSPNSSPRNSLMRTVFGVPHRYQRRGRHRYPHTLVLRPAPRPVPHEAREPGTGPPIRQPPGSHRAESGVPWCASCGKARHDHRELPASLLCRNRGHLLLQDREREVIGRHEETAFRDSRRSDALPLRGQLDAGRLSAERQLERASHPLHLSADSWANSSRK